MLSKSTRFTKQSPEKSSLVTCAVIVMGVKNGIEKSNVVMMPVLLLMAVGLAVYVAFLPGAGEGIRYYLVPDFSSCDNVGKVVLTVACE